MNPPYPKKIDKRRPPEVFLSDDQQWMDEVQYKDVELSPEAVEGYRRAMNPGYPFGHRVRNFFTAQNKAGRIGKTVKDALLLFTPYGDKIETITDLVTKVIKPEQKEKHGPMLKRAFSRAFTLDGGGPIRIRDEDGKISKVAVLAGIIRLLLILALLYGGQYLGLPTDVILNLFQGG